jgi:hypothetical protein
MNIFYPLQLFVDWLVFSVIGLEPTGLLGSAINFFIFDVLKIFILLAVIIFVVSVVRSFLPPEKVRLILSHKNKYLGNIIASVLGIITPFCSCSAIPLFLGFVQAGVPLGTTFSFLVASPLINEVALVLLLGMFGVKVAGIYVVSGLVIAVLSGIIIGGMKVEKLVEPFVYQNSVDASFNSPRVKWSERFVCARDYTGDILKKVWIYIIIGIGVGAWIHGYVPTDFLAQFAGSGKWYAVPLAILVGIPLYSNAAGIIPLVSALTEKGVALGTTLAFMMAVIGLSLPEFMILKRVMKTKLILIFAGVVGIGILLIGYLFNWLL